MKLKKRNRWIPVVIFPVLVICICMFGKHRLNEVGQGSETGNAGTGWIAEADAKRNDAEANTEKNKKANDYILPEGMTLESRIAVPEGFERITAEEDSLAAFLRNYSLKEDGTEVLLYDGTPKGNQNAHVAVFALPLEPQDLQQCADSVMRIYAEYYWETKQQDRIAFHFTNGFLAEYSKWREGYRIQVEGNEVSWVKSKDYDDSYENFVQYLKIVFSYAGTLSMNSEAAPISLSEMQVGDVFLKGGSPGHVVMIVDLCENAEGKKAFLLGQGYMPAQEFHLLKNPLHENDPWYYEAELKYPLQTPEYTFEEGSLMRLSY